MDNIFSIISIIFFILANLLLIIQGIINKLFEEFKDKKIIVEKTLYEQFSYEVYSSINTPLFLDYTITEDCPNNQKVSFALNLDTYFDCKDVHNTDLISSCRDNVINNYTNCNSENDNINNLNYDDLENFLQIDARRYCKYYSKYNQKISNLFNISICQNGQPYYYEDLLKDSISSTYYDGYSGSYINAQYCGILDTKGNRLYLPNCPKIEINVPDSDERYHKIKINEEKILSLINNSKERNLIISIVLSENEPLSHEWDYMVRETEEKIDDKLAQERRDISFRDLKLLDIGDNEDTKYHLLDSLKDLNIKVEDVNNNNNIKGYTDNKYNKNQILNIYTRNYIGFKNIDELYEFKKIFNNEDYKDNPLYKLSSSKHNPLITVVIPSAFFVLSIVFLVFKIKNIFNGSFLKIIFYIFFVLIILFMVGELIIIGFHFKHYYPKIHIDMDDKMKKVLDLYNKRTMKCQVCRIISLVLNFISLVFAIISLCINGGSYQEMQN